MSEQVAPFRTGPDPVGFFTVAKLLAVLVPTLSALLFVHTLVMKGFTSSMIEEKMNGFAVAKIEYDIRRNEVERELTKLEATDVRIDARLSLIEERLRKLESDSQQLRDRQQQVREKLGIKP